MIARAKAWGLHCARRQFFSLVLLLLLFGSLVYGLADAVQGIERGLLWPLVWVGLFLVWVLAYSKLTGWRAAALSLAAGAVLILLRVGQLGSTLATLLGESANLFWRLAQGQVPPDIVPLQSAWQELVRGVGILLARLYAWMLNTVQGHPVFDPVPIGFLWSLALWGTVVWGCWAVWRRHQPLRGAAPALALLAATLAYVDGRAFYLLPALFSVFVLRTLVGCQSRRREWDQTGLSYAPRVRSDTLWMAVGLSLALMLVAAVTPSVSIYRVVEFFHSLSGESGEEQDLARSLGLESPPEAAGSGITILDARRSSGLPTRHLLGSGPELSEQVAMVVHLEPVHPDVSQEVQVGRAREKSGPRYYWRGLTYDRYSERGWSTQYAVRVRYAAGEAAHPAKTAGRQLVRQSVRLVEEKSGLLFVAGSLVTADRDFGVAWRVRPNPQQHGDVFGATVDATSYRADSLLPVVSEADLRAAGQEYPAWIVERYLVLPDSLPDRVLGLARDLTALEPAPYDRALAIERYLRRFPYTLDVPAPPTDRDIVDYFLFDLRRGYCDYYATAMVVMARAAGLPARLVTGYASGRFDEAKAEYTVTRDQAHAWVEVYFPGYGWVDFEPTPSRPVIERPAVSLVQVSPEPDVPLEPITAYRSRLNWALWLGICGGLLVLAVAGAGLWWFIDGWRLRRMSPGNAVIELHQRLYRYGRPLGLPYRMGDTPQEFAASLARTLATLAEEHRSGRLLVSAPREIGWLTDLVIRALYSRYRLDARDRARAMRIWQRLRGQLLLAGLLVSLRWTARRRPLLSSLAE